MNEARSFAALRQRPFRGLFTGASLAMMASRTNFILSIPMLYCMITQPHVG